MNMKIQVIEDHPYIAMLVAGALGFGIGWMMFVPPAAVAPAGTPGAART